MTDAMAAKPLHVEITGELCDTETVMHSLEGGDWKSTCQGNSLVAYPTARPVLKTIVGGDSGDEFNGVTVGGTLLPERSKLFESHWSNQWLTSDK